MRLSCNGCRVLRKGCSDSCSIRPCLQWIKSPEAQSNATVFLAKFYGRAGLLNLINAGGPEHLRPAVFRSLLYEACGRIVNPIYGSVGLLWSGKWHMCQAAVEAVLKGDPIVRISDHDLHNAYDIRHVSGGNKIKKRTSADTTSCNNNSSSSRKKPKHQHQDYSAVSESDHQQDQEASAAAVSHLDSDDAEAGSHVSQAEHNQLEEQVDEDVQQQSTHNEQEAADKEQLMGLDLTLGLAPTSAGEDAGCSSPREQLPSLVSSASGSSSKQLESISSR